MRIQNTSYILTSLKMKSEEKLQNFRSSKEWNRHGILWGVEATVVLVEHKLRKFNDCAKKERKEEK